MTDKDERDVIEDDLELDDRAADEVTGGRDANGGLSDASDGNGGLIAN